MKKNLLFMMKFSSGEKEWFHGMTNAAAVRSVLSDSWNSPSSIISWRPMSSSCDFLEVDLQAQLFMLKHFRLSLVEAEFANST